MKSFFLITWKQQIQLSSAFATKGVKPDSELVSELDRISSMPFDLYLKNVTETNNGLIISNDVSNLKEIWLDYQPNNLAWPLMSSKLKDIVEMHLTGNEQITWVEVKVIGRSEQRIFYILRFEKKLDVLDTTKTIYVQGTDHIIKPVFSLQKIKNFSIFHKPLSHNLWRITSALYISDALKKSIQRAKLSGIDFEKVAVA